MKVLITDPLTDAGLRVFDKYKASVVYLPKASQEQKNKAAKDVDAWIIRSGTKISANAIASAKELRVIGRAGVGTDNIDISEATRRGVVVLNTPDVNTISAAEHTLGLILSISRNIHLGHLSMLNGKWDRHKFVGSELKGKTVGVVGLGRIGKEVITRCLGFKMKVLGYDPFVNQEMFDSEKTIITDLKTLVQKSDYISIHIPYNKETKNLFNYELLNLMKTSAFLINVARGGIINESDLALILSEEKIAGAAIDVFKQEPIEKENPLLNIKNILLSPHLGASTQEAKEGVSVSICEQICDYLKNDNLVNAVNTPISDLNKLKEMKPFLNLSELIGNLQNQLVASNPIKKVDIQCQGEIKDIKPILLSFLKGLLKPYVPERINYINAEAIAKELGIEIIINYSNMDTNYKNLISINTSTNQKSFRIDGSVFEDLKPRLVNIMDFKTEVHPRGTMLLIENIDVPGVIGNVGMFLGQLKINIGAYLLNRVKNAKNAFSIIRIDNDLSDIELQALSEIPEIIDIRQVNILGF